MANLKIRQCTGDDIETALKTIYDDRLKFLYMYLDIEECGVDEDGLDMWFFTDEYTEEIRGIAYRYYDCIHIYNKSAFCNDDLLNLFTPDINAIISNDAMIDEISKHIGDDFYYKGNYIVTTDKILDVPGDFTVQEAMPEDMPATAELMLKSHIYREMYTYDKLLEDLKRRYRDSFGRVYIIKNEEGRILACVTTNAETDEYAIIGGIAVDPEARGEGLGSAVTSTLWNIVNSEGKNGISFLIKDNEKTIAMHKKLGFEFIGEDARLIRKGE